jgi:hypothetical protein
MEGYSRAFTVPDKASALKIASSRRKMGWKVKVIPTTLVFTYANGVKQKVYEIWVKK